MGDAVNKTELEQLLDRLEALDNSTSRLGAWRIEKQPHDYPDGTTHFTHVRATAYVKDEPVTVAISDYGTPDTAELLVLMRNNLSELIQLARVGLKDQE
jgi:hypothetical protein